MSVIPRIGIVVPAFNAARFLPATLDSVLAQTVTDWECVVVDDGSPDESAAIAGAYAARDSRIRLHRQQNAGVAMARNVGLRQLSPGPPYVIFLDSDDVWEPDALEVLLETLMSHPQAAGAHGLARGIGPDGSPHDSGFDDFGRERYGYRDGRIVRLAQSDPTTLDSLLIKFTVYPPCLALLRRDVLSRIGPFLASLTPAEDWDLLARAARCGPLVFVDRVIAGYRKYGGNASNVAGGHWRRKQRVLRHVMASPYNTTEQSRLAFAAYRAWNRHTRRSRFAAAWAGVRRGQWAAALRHLAVGGGLWLGQTVSLADLRLQRMLQSRQPREASVADPATPP